MEQEVYLKIKELRKKKGMTLKDVSQKTGLAISFLSQMERGKSAITLVSLKKIANVLGLPMKELFSEPETEISEEFVRSGASHILEGMRRNYDEVSLLSGKFPNRKLDCFRVKMAPHAYDFEESSHSGEEIFYVLKGRATVFIDGKKHIVKEGETIHFPSTYVHQFINDEDVELVMFSVVTPSIF